MYDFDFGIAEFYGENDIRIVFKSITEKNCSRIELSNILSERYNFHLKNKNFDLAEIYKDLIIQL